IPVVRGSRSETDGDVHYADIPLVTVGGRNVLSVQLGIGIGLTASGLAAPKPAGSSLADLIREIKAHTSAGSSDQTSLSGGGSGFLSSLPTDKPLLVQTIVATQSGSLSGVPLVISGSSAAGAPQTALVIDARGLAAGTTLALQNVDFAAVIGNVKVTGGAGSQVVFGDSSRQHIVLGADDDTLHGGGGNDYIGSKGGDDWLYGDAGHDTVSGGSGNDRLSGGTGRDRLDGGSGSDSLKGDSSHDTVSGGSGNDRLYGNSGNDRLSGGSGADTLWGGTGADRLDGGSGNDSLKGNSGNDRITGGLGRDKMWGGSGSNVFDFNTLRESKVGSQRDVIFDFQSGRDRIDLRTIDANETRKGNQAFSWSGGDGPFLYPNEFLKAGFTGQAGELRYERGILMGDTDGDGRADFQIKIVGFFSAGDVLL
uniref:calcium-binding protein n=1 Tax=Microvirga roseola TaxID=2883126 RepID=UPI001E30E3A8